MRRWLLLCLALASQTAAAIQRPSDPSPHVLITTSDSLGARVRDQPALPIHASVVVVPSLWAYGTVDINLTFDGQPRQITAIEEAPGLGIIGLVIEPPLPPEAIAAFSTSADSTDLGAWLQSDAGADSAAPTRARLLHFRRNSASVTIAVSPAPAAIGDVFRFTDGRVAGILTLPTWVQPVHPESMDLCPTFRFDDWAMRLTDNNRRPGRTIETWAEQASPVVDDLVRVFLSHDASARSLEAFAAQWDARDPAWTTRLPQELFFDLLTAVTTHRLEGLQQRLLTQPPALISTGESRLRLARAALQVRHGPASEGIAELRAIVDNAGQTAPVACMMLADILRRQSTGQAHALAMQLLEQATDAYRGDPRPYELGAWIYATIDQRDRYVSKSRSRQTLDFSPATSLDPARQLLDWAMFEDAAAFARTGVERWPDDPDLREALIRALVGLNDLESARRHLAELGRLNPARAEAIEADIPALTEP